MSHKISFFTLFVDPVFRGPMIGSLLMSLATSLVGAIAYVRRKSLVGETISHATVPGVTLGMLFAGFLFPYAETGVLLSILIGAFFSSLLGHWVIEKLLKNRQKPDVTLCYVLASFLGFGVLLASFMQQKHVIWYRKIQIFFYGQAATMTDLHIYMYGALSLLVCVAIVFLHKPIQMACFDPIFSESIGVKKGLIYQSCSILLCLAIVIGIRSVGIVLITGMLIAPAVAAKSITQKFSRFLIVSALVGMMSALIGNYVATMTPLSGEKTHYLPTGPSTVVIASLMAFLALLFSPKKGVIIKAFRRHQFQKSCLQENLLKAFWKGKQEGMDWKHIAQWHVANRFLLQGTLNKLLRQGWLLRTSDKKYRLTEDGRKKAAYIIRLHRLWELYLVEHLKNPLEHIHRSAEEMEHFITPDIEEKLTKLLLNPTKDPHKQPIPGKEFL